MMPEDASKIAVLIDGQPWLGWTNLSVTRSLNDVASGFACSGVPFDPQTQEGLELELFAPVQILYGPTPVFTGSLDQIDLSSDGNDPHGFSLCGRSRTSILVDCTAQPKTYTYQFPLQIIQDIAYTQYLVPVLPSTTPLKILPSYTVEWGTRAFDAIDQLARENGFLVSDDGIGNLVLTTADSATPAGLLDPSNITGIKVSFAGASRYFQYLGQCEMEVGGLHGFGQAVSFDDSVDPLRKLHLSPSGVYDPAQLKVALDWQASTNVAQSINLSIEVEGWTNPIGQLWSPNQLVAVSYPPLGIDDSYLVYSVSYNYDGGASCSLSLAPQAGFLLMEPNKQPPAKKAPTKGKATVSISKWKELA